MRTARFGTSTHESRSNGSKRGLMLPPADVVLLTHVRDDRHVRPWDRAGRTLKPLKLREDASFSFPNVVARGAVVVADGRVPSRVDGNRHHSAIWGRCSSHNRGITRAPVKRLGVGGACAEAYSRCRDGA